MAACSVVDHFWAVLVAAAMDLEPITELTESENEVVDNSAQKKPRQKARDQLPCVDWTGCDCCFVCLPTSILWFCQAKRVLKKNMKKMPKQRQAWNNLLYIIKQSLKTIQDKMMPLCKMFEAL